MPSGRTSSRLEQEGSDEAEDGHPREMAENPDAGRRVLGVAHLAVFSFLLNLHVTAR